MTYTDKYGSTGQFVNGEFRPYTSQDDADALRVSEPVTDPDVPTADDADQRTKAQLKAALDAGGVQYDAKATRDDLAALAAEHSL